MGRRNVNSKRRPSHQGSNFKSKPQRALEIVLGLPADQMEEGLAVVRNINKNRENHKKYLKRKKAERQAGFELDRFRQAQERRRRARHNQQLRERHEAERQRVIAENKMRQIRKFEKANPETLFEKRRKCEGQRDDKRFHNLVTIKLSEYISRKAVVDEVTPVEVPVPTPGSPAATSDVTLESSNVSSKASSLADAYDDEDYRPPTPGKSIGQEDFSYTSNFNWNQFE